jgi:hypothetical protein
VNARLRSLAPQSAVLAIGTVLVIAGILVGAKVLPVPTGRVNIVGVPVTAQEVINLTHSFDTGAGSPWVTVAAIGFSWNQSYGLSPSQLAVPFSGCKVSYGDPDSITIPSSPSSTPPGYLPDWIVYSVNSTNSLQAVFASYESQPIVTVGTIQSGSCSKNIQFSNPIPKRFVDSPQVAVAANADGGASFFAAHPGAYTEMALQTNSWGIIYTTCSPLTAAGTGAEFLAGFEAGTGTLINATNNIGVDCSAYGPIPY